MDDKNIKMVDVIVNNRKEIYEEWIKAQLASENLRGRFNHY